MYTVPRSALAHVSLGKVLCNLMLVEWQAPERPGVPFEHAQLHKDTMQLAHGDSTDQQNMAAMPRATSRQTILGVALTAICA